MPDDPIPTGSVSSARDPAALLDVQAVAAILGCSCRHVYRLADGGKMPTPVHLGALVRWRRADIQAWIDGGCCPVRAPNKP